MMKTTTTPKMTTSNKTATTKMTTAKTAKTKMNTTTKNKRNKIIYIYIYRYIFFKGGVFWLLSEQFKNFSGVPYGVFSSFYS